MSTQELNQTDFDFMFKEFDKYGVSKDTQERLITQYKNGHLWEVNKPNSKPISTRTFDSNTQISTYSDGSITVQSMIYQEIY